MSDSCPVGSSSCNAAGVARRWQARCEKAEAERDALRKRVERVEALAEEWQTRYESGVGVPVPPLAVPADSGEVPDGDGFEEVGHGDHALLPVSGGG